VNRVFLAAARIKRALSFKKPTWIILPAAALLVVLILGFVANRQDKDANLAGADTRHTPEASGPALPPSAAAPSPSPVGVSGYSTRQEADAYAFLDAIARGEDPTGDGTAAQLLSKAFDGKTPYIENIRNREYADNQYLCDIKIDRIYEPWAISLLLDYENGPVRYYCWYTRYYEQARDVIARYIAALSSGDIQKIAEVLTPDGPASATRRDAEMVLDYYSQYELKGLTLTSFGYDDDATQFVCSVQNQNGGTFEIRLHCGDGLVGPDIWEAAHTFKPEDIHDLVSAKLHLTQEQSNEISAEAVLNQIEKLLGGAACEETFPTKCPFYYKLELTRADGETGIIYPAADSCGVFKSGSHCYVYAETNADFWELLGGHPAQIEREDGALDSKPLLTIDDVRKLADEGEYSAFLRLSNYRGVYSYDVGVKQWTYPVEGDKWQLDAIVNEVDDTELLHIDLAPVGFDFQPQGRIALGASGVGEYIDFVENYVPEELTDAEIASAREAAAAYWSRLFAGKFSKDNVHYMAHIDGQFANAVIVDRVKGKLAACVVHIDGMQRHIILTQAENGDWEVINEGT
jgi:hypothetical protein